MVMGMFRRETDVAIIGSGPGGYVAALRAADLGREVLLIEEREELGGVCLLEGCIPSKTYIHAVESIHAAKEAHRFGVSFGEMSVDLEKLRGFKESVVGGLTKGIVGLLKRRGVEVVHGRARFDGAHSLLVEGKREVSGVDFKKAIIATGSRPNELDLGASESVWSSTEALQMSEVPERLVVVGGGYIGLELGLVYAGLGSQVTVVEFFPELLPGADADLVDVMVKSVRGRLSQVLLRSKVVGTEETKGGVNVRVGEGGE